MEVMNESLSRFMTTWMRGMFNEEEAKEGFYYKAL